MGFDTQTRSIGEHDFRVTQLPFKKGAKLAFKVAQIVGPAAAELAKSESLGEAAARFFEAASEDDLERFIDAFSEVSEVRVNQSGEYIPLKKVQEVVLAGEYGIALDWMAFCFEVNFRNFSKGSVFTRLLGAATAATKGQA
jgi:hypothetical protein